MTKGYFNLKEKTKDLFESNADNDNDEAVIEDVGMEGMKKKMKMSFKSNHSFVKKKRKFNN